MAVKRKSDSDDGKGTAKNKRQRTSQSKENGSRLVRLRQPQSLTDAWGVLESISLQNFMCHSRLSMQFPGSVNFIVGHNGSGKSAILTALIVGLGGKTSSTSRGNSLKSLIKSGQNSAVVEIVLKNNGEDPVKPDVYGDRITIERRITSDGSSSYKIKNSSGKVVSTKKDDLLNILDEINLQVDNPLTCLNQEMSKNFLHSKTESDKYKFFLKSTQLEQMCRDYRYIKEQRAVLQETIKRKEKAIPGIEKEVNEKEDRFKNLATLQELKNKVDGLQHELAWAKVAELDQSLKPMQKQLQNENQRTPKYNMALDDSLKKEEEAKHRFDELNKQVKSIEQQAQNLNPEKQKKRQKFEEIKTEFKRLEQDRNRAIRQEKTLLKDKQQLEEKINELKNTVRDDVNSQRIERQEKLKKLQDNCDVLNAKIQTVTNDIEQFNKGTIKAKEQNNSLKMECQDARTRQDAIKKSLQGLTAGKRNKLQLFGRQMPEFVQKIQEACKRGNFKKEPRGPIGSLVTLRDPTLAVPVECAIGSLLTAFVVDNHNDAKVLEKIRNSVFQAQERARITIYTMKFADQVYDVSRGKAVHPQFRTVFDLLKIDDPVVANCFIDIGSIECLLVIPEVNDALTTMQHGSPPKNASRAFTKEGDEVYPDRYYSNQREAVSRFLKADVEQEIRRKTAELSDITKRIESFKDQINHVVQEMRRNENQQRHHERIKSSHNDELRRTKHEMRDLENFEEPQPYDVKDLEDEVQNYAQQILSLKEVIKQKTEECQSSKSLADAAKAECDKITQDMIVIRDQAENLAEKINMASSSYEKAKSDKEHFNKGMKKHLATIKELERNLANQEKIIADEKEKAKQIHSEPIPTRRAPKNIENEVKQIKKRIETEQLHHGNHDVIVRDYYEVQEKFKEIKKHIKWSKKFINKIKDYLEKREKTFIKLRGYLSLRCTMDFNILLDQRGFKGKLNFNHNEQTLVINVQPNKEINESRTKDLRALSGGERSFSTVCYVLALWQAIQSPLRCLDEFDVFMDMANRRVAMDMMVEMAQMQTNKQFIFLTPHDISALPKSQKIHVWRMADPKRGQSTLSLERAPSTQS